MGTEITDYMTLQQRIGETSRRKQPAYRLYEDARPTEWRLLYTFF